MTANPGIYFVQMFLLLLPPVLLLGAMALGRPTLPESTKRLRIAAIALPLFIALVNLNGSYQLSRMQGELVLMANPGTLIPVFVAWLLFVLTIAPMFNRHPEAPGEQLLEPYRIPGGAWIALALCWAMATVGVFLVYPGLSLPQLMVLVLALAVLAAGPWMSRLSSLRVRETSPVSQDTGALDALSRRRQAVQAWTCFAVIGVVVLGKTVLIAILSGASGSYTAQSAASAGDKMYTLLAVTALLYLLLFTGYRYFNRR